MVQLVDVKDVVTGESHSSEGLVDVVFGFDRLRHTHASFVLRVRFVSKVRDASKVVRTVLDGEVVLIVTVEDW